MMSGRLTRQIALVAGGLAIVGMGTLTACGKSEEKAPESTTSTTTSAPAPSPTEKAVSPGGANSFTPTVKAPPAPTALPGNVITGGS
ncbi:hypothetical protein ORI20_24725 [Mycobacterium sp. CVI_P3]|uniref:Uncharacterized protein n=1 Tax=Mycobacterium pinniadriaticum TaxID=2994102 RepID=A0ABT3SL46_9MYCO|nr:hypothetical protein [Mycobacterium pinniadriaticum]MCX2933482.1 hypothetical protein [Mycobacterium pinniadriaticum]MCX2939879.1 hypothetical protein [Mycobacterium pinniadriaticum]